MATQTSFVAAPYSRWTQLCEYREERQSLLIGTINGGPLVVCNRTDGPSVVSQFGISPSGLLYSDSNNTASGPAILRFLRSLDQDAVKQAWYAWPIPFPAVVPGTPTTETLPAAVGTTNVTFTPTDPSLAVAIVVNAGTGPVAPTLSSALLGALPAINNGTLLDGLGDEGIITIFAWQAPAAADTITLTAGVTDGVAGIIVLGSGDGTDVFNKTTGTGNSLTVSTLQLPGGVGELAVVGSIGITADPANVWRLPFTDVPAGLVVASPDGSFWALNVGFEVLDVVSNVSATIDFGTPPVTARAVVQTFLFPVTQSGSVEITVVDSFDVVAPPPPPKTFLVELPKLSPDALAALHDLVARIQSKQGD